MSTFYELSTHQAELLDKLYWEEEGTDIFNDIQSRINKLNATAEEKLAWLSGLLCEAKVNTAARKAEYDTVEQRLRSKLKQSEHIEEKLKDFIFKQMQDFGIFTVKGHLCNLSINRGRETIVFDESFDKETLPDYMIKKTTSIKVDTQAALFWLRDHEVDGVSIVRKPYLVVR